MISIRWIAATTSGLMAAAMLVVPTTIANATTADWAQPRKISGSDSPEKNRSRPELVSSSDGQRLTSLWLVQDGGNSEAWASRSMNAGATWSEPVRISAQAGEDDNIQVDSLRAASSADGQVVQVVWETALAIAGDSREIRSARFVGGFWENERRISPAADGLTTYTSPQLHLSESGEVGTITWSHRDRTSDQVQLMASHRGALQTQWPLGITITEPTFSSSGELNRYALAGSADGQTLTVAYSNYHLTTNEGDVRARFFRDGTWTGTAEQISDLAGATANAANTTIHADVNAAGTNSTIVWTSSTGTGNEVRGRSVVKDGTGWQLGSNTALSQAASGFGVFDIQLASSVDGTVQTVAWVLTDGTNNEYFIQAKRFANGQWGTGISTISTNPSILHERVKLATSADGNTVLAVWESTSGPNVSPVWNHFANNSWGTPAALGDATSAGYAPSPVVIGSGDGSTFTAAWRTEADNERNLQTRRFEDGGWGPAAIVSDSGTNQFVSEFRLVGSVSLATTTVTFTQRGLEVGSIFANHYPVTPVVVNFGTVIPFLSVGQSGPIEATSSLGGTLTYASATPAVCTVAADTGMVTGVSAGMCTINANAPGNAAFLPGTAQMSFAIAAVATPAPPAPTPTPSAPAPPVAKAVQAPAKGCVTAPAKLPTSGAKVIVKAGCVTNASSPVVVKVTGGAGRVKLQCKVGKKLKSPKSVGGFRRCASGAMQVSVAKTKKKGKAVITWASPETASFQAYQLVKNYKLK